MCGICGYVDAHKKLANMETLLRMADTLIHRGPDSSGYYLKGSIGFGFRRLSLLDLEFGDQPLYNEDHSIVVVCNGEIYNYVELRAGLMKKGHSFRTNSDIEVLPHLYEEYGIDFLNKLNGQFAFALYDAKQERLLLARDHFGICPLFYTIKNGVFVFGSEVKAILAHPLIKPEADMAGLDQILTFPGLASPRTMFKGINSLKAGCYLLFKNDDFQVRGYWDLDYPQEGGSSYDKPESYYVEELHNLLTESVKYRLQADVPVGLYLSGGLDSSLVAGITNRLYPESDIRSFSISFPGQEMSEEKFQRLSAKRINSLHTEIPFDWPEMTDRLVKVIYHSETPLKETYNTASLSLSEAAKASGVSAILTGEGADELFAGYVGYRFDQLRRNSTDKDDGYDFGKAVEDEIRRKLWGDENLFYEADYYALTETKRSLYSLGANESFSEFDCLNLELVDKEMIRGRHFIHQRSYIDFKLRLADHLLADHGDRVTLANSVEGRYPFLDIRLVEFATKIPPGLKLKGFTEKYILKQLAEGLVPPEIVRREKYAFVAPGSPYLLKQNIEWINDLLSFDLIKRQGYFNPVTVETLKQQYLEDGFSVNTTFDRDLLIIVITFGIFLDLFNIPYLN